MVWDCVGFGFCGGMLMGVVWCVVVVVVVRVVGELVLMWVCFFMYE